MATGERSEAALIRDGAEWVRRRREQLGWSQAKLAIRSTKMRGYLGEIGPAPTAADVAAFEAGELRQLPRWLKFAAYAFEFVAVPPEERCAWLNRRNWYYAEHPIDLCRPLLFRDEYRFIEALNSMSEPDRRAWRAVMTRWYSRSSEGDRAQAARDWLRRLGVRTEVLVEDEHELLEGYRRLSRRRQAEFRSEVRESASWPTLPRKPTEEEWTLILNLQRLEGDQRPFIELLAAKPGMIDAVMLLLERMSPEEVDALAAETMAKN